MKKNIPKTLRTELGGFMLSSSLRCMRLIAFANSQSKKEKSLIELYYELETHWAVLRLMTD